MKNINPLLIPGLLETLAAGDSQTFRDFCESRHPAVSGKRKFPYSHSRNAVRGFIQTPNLPGLVTPVSPDCRVDCRLCRNRNPLDRRVAP